MFNCYPTRQSDIITDMKSQNANDFLGRVFGLLTVRGNANDLLGAKREWHCLCACGKSFVARSANVKNGHTRSCGCLRIAASRKHGHARDGNTSSEYHSWSDMIQRCTNPQNNAYSDYGERGITVCQRWLTFETFLADMGIKPKGTFIERKDNDKGYEPSNCVWATRAEQARNTRRNQNITFRGKTQCRTDWAKELGMSPNTLKGRLARGSIEKALTTPVRHKYSHFI